VCVARTSLASVPPTLELFMHVTSASAVAFVIQATYVFLQETVLLFDEVAVRLLTTLIFCNLAKPARAVQA
jgi:hypothetical protein